jgi:hypothetical protein
MEYDAQKLLSIEGLSSVPFVFLYVIVSSAYWMRLRARRAQYYPPNINHSRCCDQAICTECFVQIKRAEPTTTHIVSEPAACPYCVQDKFGVAYTPPPWRTGIGSDGTVSMIPQLSFAYLIIFLSTRFLNILSNRRHRNGPTRQKVLSMR